MPEYLSPWEIANYQSRNDQYTTNYQNTLAGTAYGRARAGLQNDRARNDMNYQWDQSRAKLPGSYIGRGILNSGIFGNAMDQYATGRFKAFDNLNFNYTDQLGQMDLQDQQAATTYNTGLASTASEMAARRAELATQLRSL